MAKPDKYAEWATDTNFAAGGDPWSGTVTKREPGSGVKAKGQIPQTGFASQYYNWLLNKLYEWTKYLDQQSIDFSSFEEIWLGDTSAVSATQSPLTGFSRWGLIRTTAGSLTPALPTSSSYSGQWVDVAVTNAVGSRLKLATVAPIFWTSDECEFWMEFDVAMSATGDVTVSIGFSETGALPSTEKFAGFTKQVGGTVWEMERCDGSAAKTSTSSGAVNVSTGTMPNQTLRIEWCGANTPNGAGSDRVRFLQDDTVLLSTTSNMPLDAAMYLYADVAGNAVASRTLHLGRVRCGWNRFSW